MQNDEKLFSRNIIRMTRVEFDKKLADLDFKTGENTQDLADYFLACLAGLEKYKNETPSYELFLKIFDDARNGPRANFDLSWEKTKVSDHDNLTEWEILVLELQSLTADLIHTKKVRSQPDYKPKYKMIFEWDTEGGKRFYNGTTPGAIMGYSATRLEEEYQPSDYEVGEVSWDRFFWPIEIGISYE